MRTQNTPVIRCSFSIHDNVCLDVLPVGNKHELNQSLGSFSQTRRSKYVPPLRLQLQLSKQMNRKRQDKSVLKEYAIFPHEWDDC